MHCICSYASLYFVTCVDNEDNELVTLETIHHFVEVLDRYFGNVRALLFSCASLTSSFTRMYCFSVQVCELDIIFNFHKVWPASCLSSCVLKPLMVAMRPRVPSHYYYDTTITGILHIRRSADWRLLARGEQAGNSSNLCHAR